MRNKGIAAIHLLSAVSLMVSCTTSSLKSPQMEEISREVASEKNDIIMTNPESGLTYWQEYQALKTDKEAKKKYTLDRTDDGLLNEDIPGQEKVTEITVREKLFAKMSPELFHFLVWMRANPISTFEGIRNNQQEPNMPMGIMKFSPLPKKAFPYPVAETFVVTRMDDVLEILDNPKVFSVRNYTQKMEDSVGPFMMAYDESRYNIKEKPWMRKMLPASDLPRVRQMAKDISLRVLAEQRYVGFDVRGKEFGRLEVINQYARLAPVTFTQNYFGLKRVELDKLLEWSRATQDDFFHNLVNDEQVKKRAVVAGKEFDEYLRNYIPLRTQELKQEMANKNIPDDVNSPVYKEYHSQLDILSRLILDKVPEVVTTENNDQAARIRTNAMGTLVGSIETTQAAIAQTINELQKRPKWFKYAQEIASLAEQAEVENDIKRLNELTAIMEKIVWEAQRFHPINPIVVRYAEQEYKLNGYVIPKGAHILVATQSAMFDEKYFTNPNAFSPSRVDNDPKFLALSKAVSFVKEAANPNLKRFEAAENHAYSSKWSKFKKSYFHLGYGHHRCLGDYIGEIHVPEMVMQLLKLPGLRVVDGQAGQLDFRFLNVTNFLGDRFYYSFPESFSVEFDTQSNLPRINQILQKKEIEIANKNYAYEFYLQDFDRDIYRRCLAGWDINKAASELTKDDFKIGVVNAATTHSLNSDRKNKDFLYCRLNKEFQMCMAKEKKTAKFNHLSGENVNTGNSITHSDFDKHLSAFGKCEQHLSRTEKAFYNQVLFGKKLDTSALELNQSVRKNDLYKFEDDLKFYVRFNSRESMLNPLGWKKIPESEKSLMYTRLDLAFRLCFGKKVNIEKIPVLKAYNFCKDGVYMPKQFVKVGSLSQVERFYMLRDYLKVPGVTSVDVVKEVEARLERENP